MSASESAPTSPGLLPRATSWALQRTLVRGFLLYAEHRGAQLADSITYRTLFSVFAAVLLVFSAAAVWLSGNPDAWDALIATVNSAIPGLVGDGKGAVIDASEIKAPEGFTIAGVISLVALVGAAIGAVGSLRNSLRILADKVGADAFFVFVLLRNLLLAIAIGGLLLVSAIATFLTSASIGTVTGWLGLPQDSVPVLVLTYLVSVVIVFLLDTVVIVLMFVALSGVRPPARALWSGAALGGFGLLVLQQLSGLFVGGASSNPLLATFATLIALLLWINLSAQVILISSAVIITMTREHEDRVRARFGAATFLQRRVQRAEDAVAAAVAELEDARVAEEKERAAQRA
ncbi:YihY/virulence factor BrkB family protein [Microbacterium sp. cx-55]|uniref:YihY/virulence factor BrkB family protein n=1 Tax=unclassified Microbacterium TaxID=2609290 RepID=UPI001CBD4D9E|nr:MULTISPECIES: YihY/virulence factor BrkB family protein [unclassified Microbacterium]MBZ4486675.1 YihY/virulence factor BrkB family protein [Microbacterium sp. cx-55]MCC4907642.1 YihY/virulence factor BrkB family protein [Microbacterium sp. cx-59]UGB36365.1 YihY/virulence factor BrkB family protein [Microbacterium sp. cx-55]